MTDGAARTGHIEWHVEVGLAIQLIEAANPSAAAQEQPAVGDERPLHGAWLSDVWERRGPPVNDGPLGAAAGAIPGRSSAGTPRASPRCSGKCSHPGSLFGCALTSVFDAAGVC